MVAVLCLAFPQFGFLQGALEVGLETAIGAPSTPGEWVTLFDLLGSHLGVRARFRSSQVGKGCLRPLKLDWS
jgi:hypothetical protein